MARRCGTRRRDTDRLHGEPADLAVQWSTGLATAELVEGEHFPALRSGESCPVSGGRPVDPTDFGGVAQGGGPVHPLIGEADGVVELISETNHRGWLAAKSLWFSAPRYQGPFLVRIRRLDGGPAGVLENPRTTSFYVPPGPTAAGSHGYREITGATWVKTPGCVAWQVDGLTFSTIIIVRTVCYAPSCMTPRHQK